MQNFSYTCTETDEDKRLDYVLKFLFPLLGLRVRRRLCEEEFVCVNGKVAEASKKMRQNNIVTVKIPAHITPTTSTVLEENMPHKIVKATQLSDENSEIFNDDSLKNISYFFGGEPVIQPNRERFNQKNLYQNAVETSLLKNHSSQKKIRKNQLIRKFSLNDFPLCSWAWGGEYVQLKMENFILKESEDFAAIFKPPFVHSACIAYKNNFVQSEETSRHIYDMESLLPQIFPHKNTILLNRLDFSTSGILMVAFSKNAEKIWKEEQKKNTIKKYYLTLVEGEFCSSDNESKVFCIDGEILYKRMKKVVVNIAKQGDRLTRVLPLYSMKTKEHENFSLVLCEITKGARHQIRAHLASIGHPLVGDVTYNAKKSVNYEELIQMISQIASPSLAQVIPNISKNIFFLHHIHLNFYDFFANASLKLLPISTAISSKLYKEVQKRIILFCK